jgi:signal transduction histidine kinase/ligand-binding sensor domain-containing protein/AraC-like DNA-binding protein
MRHILSGLLLAILFLVAMPSALPAADFTFRHYEMKHGLSSNTVYGIIQDEDGYIWIGTDDGLNRFDGREFKVFRTSGREPGSIPGNHIYSLFQDRDGLIWVGTDRGLCSYDPSTDRFDLLAIPGKPETHISKIVQFINQDKEGRIWFSVYEDGVYCYDKAEHILKLYDFKEYTLSRSRGVSLISFYIDRSDQVWASSNNSREKLYRLDKASDTFKPALANMNARELAGIAFYGLTEDAFGNLWAGSWDKGLFNIDRVNQTAYNFFGEEGRKSLLHIHSVMEYEPGVLLIGSDEGISRYSITHQRLTTQSAEVLSNKFVYPIFKDKEGGLWVGTYYGGVNYYSPNQRTFTAYLHNPDEPSISGNVISSLSEDRQGMIWIGTDDGALNRFDPSTNRFTHYEAGPGKLSFHNVHGLCVDGDDLWIGTYTGGLNVLDTRTGRYRYYTSIPWDSTSIDGNSVYSVYKDNDGTIWVGTMWGINQYNRAADHFARKIRINVTTIDMLEHDSVMYFATQGKGLYTFNKRTGVWKRYFYDAANHASLISNDVLSLHVDKTGTLWIGTVSGMCRFDVKANRFIPLDVTFPSNSISYITSEEGVLWISTTKGLIRYEMADNSYRVFTAGDGLSSEQFTPAAGLRSRAGLIYLGSSKGLNVFNPSKIEQNPYVPPVVVSDFKLFNESVSMAQYMQTDRHGNRYLRLPYNKNFITLNFSALSYFAPEKNNSAYKLEGFDTEWSRIGKLTQATYTNLMPGTYVFKVKASNNDGVWNQEGLSLKIVIKRPVWFSNLFLVLYALGIIIGLVFLYRFLRKRQDNRQNTRIQKLKDDQEKEIFDAKISFFTAIAHEIRTPVSLIMGPLEQLMKHTDKMTDHFREDLSIIDRNAQRLLFLVNQLLDFRKIEQEPMQLHLVDCPVSTLMKSIFQRFKPFFVLKNIQFEYVCNNEGLIARVDEENLTKVVSNLLNNAGKYTKTKVELALITHEESHQFEIRVTDDGHGIPQDEQSNIFKPFYQVSGGNKPGTGIGLYLVKTIVDACDGIIKVQSEPGKGSIFSVYLPVIPPASDSVLADGLAIPSKEDRVDNLPQEVEKVEPGNEVSVVLVVEDNEDMQQFLWKNLSVNYRVLLAADGLEAIKVLEKNQVDLIVSDIMMPNMDGIAFCQHLRSSFLWNHLPFILLTAKTNLSTKIEAMETGADAYVEKPFSMSYLAAQVKNLLDSRKALQAKFAETPFMSLKSMAGNKADEDFLLKVNDLIEKNIANVDFSVEQLAEALCVSSSGLYAKIKTLSGITPNRLLMLVRLKKSAELLCASDLRVNEVCYMVGFNNPSYFAKCFHKQFGMLPKDFKANTPDCPQPLV